MLKLFCLPASLGFIFSIVLFSNGFAQTTQPTNPPTTQPTPPPYTEDQILRTIGRVGFLGDSETIKLGLKYLEQILTKMDLSTREDLRTALVSVIVTDPEVTKTVTAEARKLAGIALGHAKQVNASATDLITVIRSKTPEPAQEAVIAFAKTMKAMPSADIVQALKDLHMIDTLVAAGLGCGEKEIITYLVGVAEAEKRYDFLYGLSGLDAAEVVARHYLDQLNAPAAPSALVATATTPTSVQLDWADNSTNEEQFVVLRSDTVIDGSYAEITKVPGNQIHYSDTSVKANKTYYYQVKSLNGASTAGSTPTASVAVTTPEVPTTEPSTQPSPTPPPLPTSPPAAILYSELTKRLAIYIEGNPHPGIIEAIVTVIKKGRPEVAVNAGNFMVEKFDRAAFDFSPLLTSLGLRTISEIKSRAGVMLGDQSIPPHLRTAYNIALNANSRGLSDRFLNNPANPLMILFRLMSVPDQKIED